MRHLYLLLISTILVLIAANVYYYLSIYRQQVSFQKNILTRQTEICSWEIEQHISNLVNEINYILFTEDITRFYNDPEVMESSSSKIEVFFSKYGRLVTSISVMDNRKNVYTTSKDQDNNLVTDIYVSRTQRELHDRETFDDQQREYIFILPTFSNDSLIANMVVRIDTRRYAESVFSNYYIKNTLWQTLVTKDGNVVFSTLSPNVNNLQQIDLLTNNWPSEGKSGSIIHKLETPGGLISVISSYYPISILDHDMLIVFSLDTSIVISSIITSVITISAATFIVLVLIILVFLYFIRKERREKQKSMEAEQSIKDIFESLPTGIIIKGLDGRIRMINSTALKILKIKDPESVKGKDISNMFFLFRDYQDSSVKRQIESTSEYVYYDTDDNELILYKKEILSSFLGEEVMVEAFIDISPIEEARRNEFFFGEAKTEFLKRISFDIRNPLNGIMNIAASIGPEVNRDKSVMNKTELIRQCCDDIMLVVNDIMDFSGFEEGRTLVEEIPFVLSEEIEIALNLFREKAREKGIRLTSEISPKMPAKFIGDPFHLRQILTNLVSNSLKYTEEGEISIFAEIRKQISGIILIEFILEDTGAGISPELTDILNQNGNEKQSVPGGGFGLRKTRQLINLMKGDLRIESPVVDNPKEGGPGTRVIFSVQLYSNEFSGKELDFCEVNSYKDIRALVLAEPGEGKQEISSLLSELDISNETTEFNESTIDLLKSRISGQNTGYSILVIIDSQKSNGFTIARSLHENELDQKFLIILISSVNKTGNFLKSRRFGADHYLIGPYDRSEIFDIIQTNFPHVAIPNTKKSTLKRVRNDLKILVAEDNNVNQIVAKSLFRSIGYDVDIAPDGKEVIEMVKKKQYDIIFMDIRMPGKNGLDTTYEIRRLGYKMPVIAMTANAGETDKTKAMEVGMNDFIVKPVRIDILKNIMIRKFAKDNE